MVDGLDRDLELQDDAVGALQHGQRLVDVGRRQAVVRPFHHDDPVLPVRIDEDGRDAARRTLDDAHVLGADAMRLEVLNRRRPEQVRADARDHVHLGAAEPRRHRLIGALSAPAEIEVRAEDRLSGVRKPIAERDQIDVGAADDGDARRLAMFAGAILTSMTR